MHIMSGLRDSVERWLIHENYSFKLSNSNDTSFKILIKNGHRVYFISKQINKNLRDHVKKNKIKIIFINKQSNQIEDAKQMIFKVKKIYKKNDWIIVDHYNLGFLWERKIKLYFPKLFVIDDFINAKHDCDLFLNQNLMINSLKL